VARTKTVVTVISKISERPANPHAAMVVIYGLELGRKYDLVDQTLVVGRSSKADIQIDQESVSRNHAKIVAGPRSVTVQDLGSTNGTFVNDQVIEGTLQLRNGDLIKIGRTIFKYIAGGNIEAAYHDEIYRLTTVDGLTQVFNRRYFEEALEREISRCNRYGRELTLVLMDIDHFKKINDTHGHLAGDHVLKQLASAVKTRIRREDIFARYGGEEFALLLPEVDPPGALLMAEKVRKLVEQHPFRFDNQVIPVTVSVGLATLQANQDCAELIRAADTRLYQAKDGGRNRVVA
jgi:two-component system cell cycle response regulator